MSDEHGHEHSRDGDHDDHPHDGDHGPGSDDHHADDADRVAVAVLTVSSTRSVDDDPAGDAIVAAVEDAGHEAVQRAAVPDEAAAIEAATLAAFDDAGADVVVTTGGTGLTPDDVTPEAARGLFDRRVPGFGELFRYLSYEDVGPMAMASRATAGVVDDGLLFCLPGSEAAARLGAEELIAPTVGHLLGLVRR
ncbi:MogA/MoaB family molybdenum cofactor biosynthesis protein [Haloarcula litorea]|uniref:MogA/MoaB family molybdenum cofactor biosynthesis protein n=1 Tax=Haloarcula litorea TaxID=3032579 RepID=UPI0023E8246C|nr:MogA/MoaB family molybdenum cofactor biosynthesis protein [Halomicroarcula sp. GDY20]